MGAYKAEHECKKITAKETIPINEKKRFIFKVRKCWFCCLCLPFNVFLLVECLLFFFREARCL